MEKAEELVISIGRMVTGAYSVSEWKWDTSPLYIKNQRSHHEKKKTGFQDEYRAFWKNIVDYERAICLGMMLSAWYSPFRASEELTPFQRWAIHR